jgi:thiamine biosynthesis lipoprotein
METFKAGFQALGGDCEITLAASNAEQASAAIEVAIAEIGRIEKKYSRYREDSLLSQINAGAGSGEWFICDPETLSLLAIADRLYETSDGLFDITSGIFRRVWDFRAARLPDATEIEKVLACIGWPLVERNGEAIRLPSVGMEIDFGGFGKEYAADQAAAVLAGIGIGHGMVNLGGDVRVLGPQPDGTPWIVGIRHPREPGKILASIPLSHGALTTSGDYERYFEVAGKRYCHILHPQTGYPVSHWQSLSVFGPDALTVGSCSTIGMLKEATAIDFLKQRGLKFLAIDQQQQIFTN